MGEYGFVAERYARVLEGIGAAAARSGRRPEEVSLLAVTKFHPLEAVEAAYAAGARLFGENRVQEAEAKYPAFLAAHADARLEMIGHLQSNKARKAPGLFSRVQSVDSVELLAELDRRAAAAGLRLELLFELRTGEDSKSGFAGLDELWAACEAAAGMASAVPRGLMTMAPLASDPAPVRAAFRRLRSALEEAARRFAFPGFDVLSMGMSGDYELAVEEGSTLVRVGTAIFGERRA
ncbi:MAG TPA: YggS family pyridoxal phosphate-dependent enzyme [Spirochaetia bacterium]|nr:YggS family pyridoxal phosphate-dependent enzyme [Spirochaetia bacterium]HRZ65132.1 YggS family pyridoxal phosphate-dependent enzyme [Spirochaetia bacterium]